MKQLFSTIILLLAMYSMAYAKNPSNNFHIYLCIGQSNMAGQASITDEYKNGAGPRFLKMGTVPADGVGKWSEAIPPLSHEGAKMGPADFFGREMLKLLPPTDTVAVIVVAVEGCSIRLFNEDTQKEYIDEVRKRKNREWFFNFLSQYGGDPYQCLIDCAQKAQQRGVIEGILLHQGEADAYDEQWNKRVKDVYNHIISDLHLNPHEVPIIAGEIARNGEERIRNGIIHRLPLWIDNAAVVSSRGCTLLPDNIHFTLKGYEKLGKRYARQMLKMKRLPQGHKEH